MQEAAEKILKYCAHVKNENEFKSDHKTVDACIRNLQILGEAARHVPSAIKADIPAIPWNEIQGMRNILVHEYFGASASIIWRTVSSDLPRLLGNLKKAVSSFDTPVHPWKICPAGEFYVRKTHVHAYDTKGFPVRDHLRKEHCRADNGSGKDVLTLSEAQDMAEIFFRSLTGPPSANDLGFGQSGTKFDHLIRGWTRYWNEVLRPEVLLDPDIVKALIASESGFRAHSGKGDRKKAKGLMQLMPMTVKYLKGYRNELKDQLFEFDSDEVFDPSLNISAGIRWLFRKKATASSRLKRPATWEEAVSEYKDYLRRVLKNPKLKPRGMEAFRDYLKSLKGGRK